MTNVTLTTKGLAATATVMDELLGRQDLSLAKLGIAPEKYNSAIKFSLENGGLVTTEGCMCGWNSHEKRTEITIPIERLPEGSALTGTLELGEVPGVTRTEEIPEVLLTAIVGYAVDGYDTEGQCDGLDGCNGLHHAIHPNDSISVPIFMGIAKTVETVIKDGIRRHTDIDEDVVSITNEAIRKGLIRHNPVAHG